MRLPPNRCLFCLSTVGPFLRKEHPVPESLGNDETVLAPGFVCDLCNQYFGTKLEAQVLASPPFNIERVAQAVKTKKGRYARYQESGFSVVSTGYWDRVVLSSPKPTTQFLNMLTSGKLYVFPLPNYADLIVRFLLKIGLESLLLSDEFDPYTKVFDNSRLCARYGEGAGRWDVAYGIYPSRRDLILSTRIDRYGPLETRQLYQYEIGVLESGDCILSFVYVDHVFACNLSRPYLTEYLMFFNANNSFSLRRRWA